MILKTKKQKSLYWKVSWEKAKFFISKKRKAAKFLMVIKLIWIQVVINQNFGQAYRIEQTGSVLHCHLRLLN